MSTVTDYLEIATSGTGLIHAASGYYVQLRSQTGGGTYTSVAVTDATGYYTITGVPPDSYEIWYSKNLAGPWTDSRRTQNVISGGYISVVDYGADSTGIADSTTVLNAAFAAAAGGMVWLPKGTYKFSGPLTLPDNTILAGPGTLRLANSTNLTSASILLTVGNGCTLRDFTFDGNRQNQTSGCQGITPLTVVGCKILGVTVKNTWQQGINLYQGSDHLVDGCEIDSAGAAQTDDNLNAAIQLYQTVRVRIVNCQIKTAGSMGIICAGSGSTDLDFSHNYIWSCYSIGIALGSGTTHARIVGNRVGGTSTHLNGGNPWPNMIDIGTVTDCVITGNDVSDGAGGIIDGPPSYNVSVVGNRVTNCAGYGILLGGVAGTGTLPFNTTIEGNVVSGCAWIGILVGTGSGAIVANNVVKNNGTDATNASRCGISVFGFAPSSHCSDFIITGNRCTDDQVTKTQQTGIRIDDTAPTRIIVANNDLVGNAANAVVNTAGAGAVTFRHNAGLNPVGSFTAPTFPATGVASAAQSYDASVWIKSGTNAITAIAIGGTTVTVGGTNVTIVAAGAIGGPFRVPAGQTVTLTYTAGGTPAWVWYGD